MREAVDMTAEATHEVLALGADLLEFAPVVGLAEAARVLVNIWDAVQETDINQLACLRLTERCANILISVREEIDEIDRLAQRSPPSTHSTPPALHSPPELGHHAHSDPGTPSKMVLSMSPHKPSPLGTGLGHYSDDGATPRAREGHKELPGGNVSVNKQSLNAALAAPMEKLVSAFNNILGILQKQNRRPFLKRYLKREEIREDLVWCDALLNDAMNLFDVRILFRIYTRLVDAEEQRQADNAALMGHILHTSPLGSSGSPLLPPYQPPDYSSGSLSQDASASSNPPNMLGLDLDSTGSPPAPARPVLLARPTAPEMVSRINQYNEEQNERAFQRDAAYLRQVLSTALATNDDMEMIKILQVNREEMPEALKALQRALETEMEKERVQEAPEEQEESVDSTQGIVDGVQGRKSTASTTVEPVQSNMNTFGSFHSQASTHSRASTRSRTSHTSRDTLDREFIESGIESLRRLSMQAGQAPASLALPPWTITRYEVDRDEQVGMGTFSVVWRGRYKGQTVAVKMLSPATPREMFLKEVDVWRALQHQNVLRLIGASAIDVWDHRGRSGKGKGKEGAAEEEGGPWFFVSRYYPRGNLVKWVKGLHTDTWQTMLGDASAGVLRMIHEISDGMAYLHHQGVLHGDLKCSNILIDDDGHCIISDFGQSLMKSEAARISGADTPRGTLLWQAPELMSGSGSLTQATDVYAFAMSCIEILHKGSSPWPLAADDGDVRRFVLESDMRPEVPMLCPWSHNLALTIRASWAKDPDTRPSFTRISASLSTIRRTYGWNGINSPYHESNDLLDVRTDAAKSKKSPSMRPPQDLPTLPHDVSCSILTPFPEEVTPKASTLELESEVPSIVSGRLEPIAIPSHLANDQVNPERHTSDLQSSSSFSGERISGPASPLPVDEAAAETRDEKRYRMLLQHEYHMSLTLPLWEPTPVALGAVGYHLKPEGRFVTLLNAFRPMDSSGGKARDMPSLYGFGKVQLGSQKSDKRTVLQRGMGRLHGWMTKGRGDDTPTGHKVAHLFTELTTYHYMTELDTPKRWLHANVDQLLLLYGTEHAIQKEDLMLVIGTLDAQEYALYVSHDHPNGQVNFDVFSSTRPGQVWGKFSTTEGTPPSPLGPVYHQETPGALSAHRVSQMKQQGAKWDTVLLAKLRFPPDQEEPTSQ
ncbi:hypothetical protein EIP86_010417 [Pleurotus ostreatoroseus]|nr:hypothetical protein EIP86_010417 [Pleurotus ostreatoroseus]